MNVLYEGVRQESVQNFILDTDNPVVIGTEPPEYAIEGSDSTTVTVTGAVLGQTINSLRNLLKVPHGCGEQNMVRFAPNVFIAHYLKETGLDRAQVMKQALRHMMTGYQRQLTYQRYDGSFSAFGDSDKEGSLWLTAFVLKTFSQADGLIHIDPYVVKRAANWTISHQNHDGSFKQVGFVHDPTLMGGTRNITAMTAYVASALLETGHESKTAMAIGYLEENLQGIHDPYTLALTAYTLSLSGSHSAADAVQRLPDTVNTPDKGTNADIETAAYALMAMVQTERMDDADRMARWLTSQRSPQGGFGATQATVVAIQALSAYAANSTQGPIDMTITLAASVIQHEIVIDQNNVDEVHTLHYTKEDPLVLLLANGPGEALVQATHRHNIERPPHSNTFQLQVHHDRTITRPRDTVTVTADLRYTPQDPDTTGMVVLELGLPTGLTPSMESIEALRHQHPDIGRVDVQQRGIAIYLRNLQRNSWTRFIIEAKAMVPVKAQPALSRVYLYYNPELEAQALGTRLTITGTNEGR